MSDSEPPVVHSTHPPDPLDTLLQQKFIEDLTQQSGRLDDFAKQLFTLELAIPGAYATVLKLIAGKDAVLNSPYWWSPFMLWGVALITTLISLFPFSYTVDRTSMRNQPQQGQTALSIEGFYEKNARDKRRALWIASLCFFLGVIIAAGLLF